MIVCSCNRLNDRDVRDCATKVSGVSSVYKSLGCAPQCGRCAQAIHAILREEQSAVVVPDDLPGECECAGPMELLAA